MIKNGVFLGDVHLDFYGDTEGSCAWCNKPRASEWYINETPLGENAVYNVCHKCYKEGIGL